MTAFLIQGIKIYFKNILLVHFLLPIEVIIDAIGQCFFFQRYCLFIRNFEICDYRTLNCRKVS